MPIVRISLGQSMTADSRKIGACVYTAMRETIGIPEGDNFQVVTRHTADELIYDSDLLRNRADQRIHDRGDHPREGSRRHHRTGPVCSHHRAAGAALRRQAGRRDDRLTRSRAGRPLSWPRSSAVRRGPPAAPPAPRARGPVPVKGSTVSVSSTDVPRARGVAITSGVGTVIEFPSLVDESFPTSVR